MIRRKKLTAKSLLQDILDGCEEETQPYIDKINGMEGDLDKRLRALFNTMKRTGDYRLEWLMRSIRNRVDDTGAAAFNDIASFVMKHIPTHKDCYPISCHQIVETEYVKKFDWKKMRALLNLAIEEHNKNERRHERFSKSLNFTVFSKLPEPKK